MGGSLFFGEGSGDAAALALAWLDGHTNLETGGGVDPGDGPRSRRRPGLERIRALTDLLGRPHADFPLVHVTGTNGKTTTSRLCAHLLGGYGLSVGVYTSPHLESVNERLTRVGPSGPLSPGVPSGDDADMGAPIVTEQAVADDDLAGLLDLVAAAERILVERDGDLARPSWFEVVTAAAYRWFGDLAVEVAVAEVGLGGRWDATNVADGAVAVVTNVAIDHAEYLGDTREEIAAEKAGIVKRGATLVLGETDPGLAGIFFNRDPGRVVRAEVDFGVVRERRAHGGRALDLRTPRAEYEDLYLPLHGAHQSANAALALTAAEVAVGEPLPYPVVAAALASFTAPGRLEILGRAPLLIVDGAHNPAGAEALVAALDEEFAPAPRILVVGFLADKDPAAMLGALRVAGADRVIACPPPSPRARPPADVAAAAVAAGAAPARVATADDVVGALSLARAVAGPEAMIVVTGSLYLVGAARAVLRADRVRS